MLKDKHYYHTEPNSLKVHTLIEVILIMKDKHYMRLYRVVVRGNQSFTKLETTLDENM